MIQELLMGTGIEAERPIWYDDKGATAKAGAVALTGAGTTCSPAGTAAPSKPDADTSVPKTVGNVVLSSPKKAGSGTSSKGSSRQGSKSKTGPGSGSAYDAMKAEIALLENRMFQSSTKSVDAVRVGREQVAPGSSALPADRRRELGGDLGRATGAGDLPDGGARGSSSSSRQGSKQSVSSSKQGPGGFGSAEPPDEITGLMEELWPEFERKLVRGGGPGLLLGAGRGVLGREPPPESSAASGASDRGGPSSSTGGQGSQSAVLDRGALTLFVKQRLESLATLGVLLRVDDYVVRG